MPVSTDKKWLKGRYKHVTGFCNDNGKPGQHEGQKPRSGGNPLPTCPYWQECPCVCHQNVDFLFEQTGMERIEVPNPEYIPYHTEFVMPVVPDLIDSSVALTPDGVSTPPNRKRAAQSPSVAAETPLAQRRTDTGRAARGGLEAQVWDACRLFLAAENNYNGGPITPRLICEWIAQKYKIPTPSSGAVNSVLDRWEKLNFAKKGKKPNRFLGFVETGSWEELIALKSRTKGAKKRALSLARRGYR